MKNILTIFLILGLLCSAPSVFSQASVSSQDFGISVGGYTNFPANQDYLNDAMSVIYVAPYIKVGRHEFSLGLQYPLPVKGLYDAETTLNPMPGALAGYKFYILDPEGRENVFIHYAFQYLRFKSTDVPGFEGEALTEKDMYINNVLGLGYNLYFDMQERFGLYYTLDYLVSQAGLNITYKSWSPDVWETQYIWNRLSTHIGFTFKIVGLKKKEKK
jgi:hypothetical protein